LWYPATIISLDLEHQCCVVQYDEYLNEEEQSLADLYEYTEESSSNAANAADSEQLAVELAHASIGEQLPTSSSASAPAAADNNASLAEPSAFTPAAAAYMPPVTGMDESLSAMLLSWYMCGYHTGYHQALKDAGAGRKS